jgi:hypothetical protein
LGKKNGKTQPLLVRQCQIPLFSAKIPVFLAKKKKHVWNISWVGPPPFSVKIKGSPQAQQPHPRVQPPSLPAAAATWEW